MPPLVQVIYFVALVFYLKVLRLFRFFIMVSFGAVK
jgi:hypothetical protein